MKRMCHNILLYYTFWFNIILLYSELFNVVFSIFVNLDVRIISIMEMFEQAKNVDLKHLIKRYDLKKYENVVVKIIYYVSNFHIYSFLLQYSLIFDP